MQRGQCPVPGRQLTGTCRGDYVLGMLQGEEAGVGPEERQLGRASWRRWRLATASGRKGGPEERAESWGDRQAPGREGAKH